MARSAAASVDVVDAPTLVVVDAPAPTTPKKAPLTLSQRRACLKLADGAVAVTSAFNAAPLDHLVEHGLAAVEQPVDPEAPGPVVYVATEAGLARASELNPKWKTWKPASTAAASIENLVVAALGVPQVD